MIAEATRGTMRSPERVIAPNGRPPPILTMRGHVAVARCDLPFDQRHEIGGMQTVPDLVAASAEADVAERPFRAASC